ncbi:hypothetical protein ES703_36381 [subsurface metagenome]
MFYNRGMNWMLFVLNNLKKIPIERVLFPPRDNIKAMEEFASGLKAPVAQNKAPISQNVASATTIPKNQVELPTSAETAQELKRRLGKELYRAELDLSNKLRIASKPCDCLSEKHTLMLEAAAEELIAQEPDSTVYLEIIDWIKRNQSKVTIEAIVSGQYDEEYPRMAAEFKGFRKRIMGTNALTAMVQPKEQVSPH